MCQVGDEDGRTPLHLAIMKGQQKSVCESDKKGTLLHLSVVYNRLNVFILILESTDQDLLNIKDDNGNTILHSAAALRWMLIIKYLVKCTRSDEVNLNVLNENGLTALDIIQEMPKDTKTAGIKEFLTSAGALTSAGLQLVAGDNMEGTAAAETATASNSKLVKMWKKVKNFTIFQEKMEKRDETLLVAASEKAAMAYQAAISPPGGVAGMDAPEYQKDYANSPYFKTYDLEPASSLLSYFYEGLNN
ncbi:uncharacterized protein LOC141691099 [Apium graveolens]|uniref:uncharacterized protein LOC141691099 n=1 Tax=Apium graveolens TaxID=4045 RepID=UPI003D7978CB